MFLKRTTLITIGCASVLIGLFVAKFIEPISLQWVWLALCVSPLAFTRKLRIVFVVVVMLLIGLLRGGMYQQTFHTISQYYGEKVTVTGLALEDGTYSYNGQLETTLNIKTINGQDATGRITLRGFEPVIYRYDSIEATGKISPTKGGKQGTMSYADISVLAVHTSAIESFRHAFIVGMQNALPEPAASLGIGILVGQRSLLPDDVASALQIAGLTHIIAVSGYNLTIIINAVKRTTRRLSRFQTVAVSASLMYAFLLITGFSPSIVRASLVAGISLATWYYGRTVKPLLLILFVAALTAVVNPYYVWGDIGWYLSFLAFFGVLIVAPLIIRILARGKQELPLLPTVAIESFSAQIMTLPLTMYIFGKMSVIGLLANIIIVPMVPIAMLASVVAGVMGVIAPAVAGWLAIPARILLGSMIRIAEWMAALSHATVIVQISAAGMVFLYVCIIIMIVGLKKRAQSVIISK